MKYLLYITTLSLLLPLQTLAVDPMPFAKVEPEEAGQSKAALKLKAGEKLYIKVAGGFVIIGADNIKSIRENNTLLESCLIEFSHIDKDSVFSDTIVSTITYNVTLEGEDNHLTKIKGTQSFRVAGIQLSWSYSAENLVYIYVPKGTKCAIAGKEKDKPNRKQIKMQNKTQQTNR